MTAGRPQDHRMTTRQTILVTTRPPGSLRDSLTSMLGWAILLAGLA